MGLAALSFLGAVSQLSACICRVRFARVSCPWLRLDACVCISWVLQLSSAVNVVVWWCELARLRSDPGRLQATFMESTDEDLKKLAAEAANGRLKGLTDEAERGARDIHVADHMPIKRFFYAAKTILQQARTLAGEQDLERAYVLLIRFSTLFVEVLPTHAGFKSAEVAADRKALIKEVSKVLEEAELVKNVLRSRYLVDDEARIRAEVELRARTGQLGRRAAA